MRYTKIVKKPIILILITLFLITACKREKDKDEPVVLQQEEKTEIIDTEKNNDSEFNAKTIDENAITLNPSQSNSSQNTKSRTVPGAIESNNYLFYEQDKDIIIPEDFEIGQLLVYSDRTIDERQNKAYRDFINKFFSELRKQNIPESMIMDENLFFLTNIFNSYIEKELIPDNIRVGKVITTKDGLRLNLRMYKGQNRTEGEIFLAEINNSYKVKEFYGDLGILDIEYDRSNEKFEPEIYKF